MPGCCSCAVPREARNARPGLGPGGRPRRAEPLDRSVEGISVRERLEVATHLRLTLDNGGIEHLCDEMDAVESGRWTDTNEGFSDGESAGDKADALYVPSGPTWRPRADLNR